jgi:mono/diheme cytochrome c family protein
LKSLLKLMTVLGVIVAVSGLAGCQARPSLTEIEALLGDQPASSVPSVAAAPVARPTAQPVTAPTPALEQNCVNCHTNDELLKSLAKEPEPSGEESSGEG